jgi:hypothetical protein
MDTLKAVVNVPRWAYDFCNYYLIIAVIMALYGVYALIQLFMMPGMIKKFVPTTTIAIGLILSIGLSVILSMMQFWICRSALAPSAVKEKFQAVGSKNGYSGVKMEGFADKCSGDGDCTAITGTPQGSMCSCGGRGLCGGCVMRNNMEPQQEFSAQFAPFAEGFRVSRR